MLKDSYFYLCKKIYTCNIDIDYKSLEFLFSIYSDTLGNIIDMFVDINMGCNSLTATDKKK